MDETIEGFRSKKFCFYTYRRKKCFFLRDVFFEKIFESLMKSKRKIIRSKIASKTIKEISYMELHIMWLILILVLQKNEMFKGKKKVEQILFRMELTVDETAYILEVSYVNPFFIFFNYHLLFTK